MRTDDVLSRFHAIGSPHLTAKPPKRLPGLLLAITSLAATAACDASAAVEPVEFSSHGVRLAGSIVWGANSYSSHKWMSFTVLYLPESLGGSFRCVGLSKPGYEIVRPSSFFETPSASSDFISKSIDTVGSPASIFATRD